MTPRRLACVFALSATLALSPGAGAAELPGSPFLPRVDGGWGESGPTTGAVPTLSPALAFEPLAGDGRRTLGRFGANLGRSFLGVVSGDNLRPFLLGVGAAGAGSFLDGASGRFFERNRAQGFGDTGQRLGQAGVLAPAAAMLFVAGRASNDPRFRATTYDAAQAYLVTGAYTTVLKYTVGRQRPSGSDRLSFPSGHTSTAVALATVADHHYGHKLGIPAYAVAGLVGISRIEKKAHHLSDVLAGAALGYLVGRTVVRENGQEPPHRSRLQLGPAFPGQGSGVGLSVSLRF